MVLKEGVGFSTKATLLLLPLEDIVFVTIMVANIEFVSSLEKKKEIAVAFALVDIRMAVKTAFEVGFVRKLVREIDDALEAGLTLVATSKPELASHY